MESENQEPQPKGAQGQPEPAPTVDTPVATPVPRRNVITRRLFVLGGFWSTLTLAFVGLVGPSLDFAWPRKVAGAARKVFVSADRIPEPGDEPVAIPEGRFFLVNLEPGVTPHGEKTEGGLLAMWRKCPHLGCTVPWRSDFTFADVTGWFRCPCHGSTYTKEGGVLVFGPAPRSLDLFEIEKKDDGSGDIVVNTGVTVAEKGGADNPSKTTSYEA